ncbi:ABC transporter permease [Aquamicrobium terrae]
MFHFILADLRRNWIGALILVLLIALATALGVSVTLQERALRLGSARAAAAFDLVVGAAGSETQLILSSIFLQPAPLPLLPPETMGALRADARVDNAVPVGFGDFVAGYPIVGTTADAVRMLGGLAEGEGFSHMGDAVVGAQVARSIGDSFHPFHGTVGEAGEVHSHVEYRVVGRMAPTGTPWDRAILVPIQSVWETHADHDHSHGPVESAGLAAVASVPHADDHDHGSGFAGQAVDESELLHADNPGVPAILVKPKSIADAYNLRQQYRTETTLAVFPGEVLTRLYGTLGDARRVLGFVATGAQALVGAAILMVVAVHVLQRRRQIGALRAFGASRPVVMGMVWMEVFVLVAAGVICGFAIGYAIVRAISGHLASSSGVAMPVEFQAGDLWTLAGLLAACAVATFLPALIAYRQSPAQALRA